MLLGVVDTHAHIPNMHRATLYHMLCILKVHFGAFGQLGIGIYKKVIYTLLNPINHQTIYICMCFMNGTSKIVNYTIRLRYEPFEISILNYSRTSIFC